jgi:hypothetical protein
MVTIELVIEFPRLEVKLDPSEAVELTMIQDRLNGRPVELMMANKVLFWRYYGDVAWIELGDLEGPAGPDRLPTQGTGPLIMLNGVPVVGRRIETWANRGTGAFTGQILIASDLRASFYWDGTRWRPTQNRVRIFSSVVLSGAGQTAVETVVRSVSIPNGLCEVGCLIRVVGVSTWSSTSASAKTIRLKASNNASANIGALNSIANRSRSVVSSTGYFGFNKPLIAISDNRLWTGTINMDTEVAGVEGLTPNFIDGINCTSAWTLWLTHQKPLAGDIFDNHYFFVDIEFP